MEYRRCSPTSAVAVLNEKNIPATEEIHLPKSTANYKNRQARRPGRRDDAMLELFDNVPSQTK
jgi:hypothetical protein